MRLPADSCAFESHPFGSGIRNMKRLAPFLLILLIQSYARAAAVNTRFVAVSPVPFYAGMAILFVGFFVAFLFLADRIRLYIVHSQPEYFADKNH